MFGVRLTDALIFHALGEKEVFEGLDLESTGFSMCVEIPIKPRHAFDSRLCFRFRLTGGPIWEILVNYLRNFG